MLPIYLDYAATTPCDKQVADCINKHLTIDTTFANPASRTHYYGWQAQDSVEKARGNIAKLINAHITEIIFTSGATESNNIVLANAPKNREIISSSIEHSSINNMLRNLLDNHKNKVKFLAPNSYGIITLENLKNALTEDTKMVSLMAVNNELGSINPIYEIGEYLADKNILFHIDAAQAFGKIALDSKKLKADFISICAHKIYGPKGIGALFIRHELLETTHGVIIGGSQERNIRGGTLATHQIAGFGMAAKLAQQNMVQDYEHLTKLRATFLSKLQDINFHINSPTDTKLSFPGILNICFPGVDSETLIGEIPELAVSTGSACSAGDLTPSRILLAIGLTPENALSSLRFSFGRYTSLEDAAKAGTIVQKAVYNLQNKS